MDAEDLKNAIEEAGFEPRSYSGRGMMGKECVGVSLESEGDVWDIAVLVGAENLNVRAPRIDSLGRGMIAYWPSVEWA